MRFGCAYGVTREEQFLCDEFSDNSRQPYCDTRAWRDSDASLRETKLCILCGDDNVHRLNQLDVCKSVDRSNDRLAELFHLPPELQVLPLELFSLLNGVRQKLCCVSSGAIRLALRRHDDDANALVVFNRTVGLLELLNHPVRHCVSLLRPVQIEDHRGILPLVQNILILLCGCRLAS